MQRSVTTQKNSKVSVTTEIDTMLTPIIQSQSQVIQVVAKQNSY